MDFPFSLPDVTKIFRSLSVPFSNLQLPFVVLAAISRHLLMRIVSLVTTIANSLSILICYIYLKNYKHHSVIVVDGYITIFKTFAEFISAIMCLAYGLMELDFFYTVLGGIGIIMGLILKALLLYGEHHEPDSAMEAFIYCWSGLYIMCVLCCSFAFHAAAMMVGVLPCVTRIMTCIVPLVALSEFFWVSGPLGRFFAYLVDFVAVSVLWWNCAHLSLKYFVLLPSVMGLIFSFIQYVMVEHQKVSSTEVVSNIYQRQSVTIVRNEDLSNH